jgi:hypothetical protein
VSDLLPRYRVERENGQDPPEPRYVVLDLAHDYAARVAARHYVTVSKLDGKFERAAVVEAAIHASDQQFQAWIKGRNPAQSKTRRKSRA